LIWILEEEGKFSRSSANVIVIFPQPPKSGIPERRKISLASLGEQLTLFVEGAFFSPQGRKLGSGSERSSQEERAEPSSAAHKSQDVEKGG